MSKVQDVVRGLYFRKSKQEKLQQAIDRIESTQQDFARALERMEVDSKIQVEELGALNQRNRTSPQRNRTSPNAAGHRRSAGEHRRRAAEN